jgi:hypothetical protein
MLIQILSRAFIVLEYQINKEYIAAVLCVNKSKPQLKCEGSCYLQKNLKKAEQPENQSAEKTFKADLTLFVQACFTCNFTLFTEVITRFSRYLMAPTANYLWLVFHPPLLQSN